MLSSFEKHFQLIVFRKLFGWKLEKSYTKKCACHLGVHQRSLLNTTGKENLVQNMLNDRSWAAIQKFPIEPTNQPTLNPIRERSVRPDITHDVIDVHNEGQVVQPPRSFQSNQPIPNPSRERRVRPVVEDDTRTVQDVRKTSLSQEIDVN